MRRPLLALCLILILGAAGTAPERKGNKPFFTPAERAAILQMSPLPRLPPDPTDRVADNSRAARFGQYLFFDKHLSANDKVACSSCHEPDEAFTDGRRVGVGEGIDDRNTPTVLNAAYNHWFFWDGRADSLWAQALYVMESPEEFGSDRLHIAHVIYANPALRQAYTAIFGPLPPLADTAQFPQHARQEPGHPQVAVVRAWRAMTPADRAAVNRVFSNLGKAIEAYERRLVSTDAPFDTFVAGLRTNDAAEQAVLSNAAKRGLRLFVGPAHCNLCHSGPTLSDGQFHNLGLPVLPGEPVDKGRAGGIPVLLNDVFNGTGTFSDNRSGTAKDKLEFLPSPKSQLGAFKTPALRNVALTEPYMHDGRLRSLRQVVTFYSEGKAASVGKLVGKRELLLNLIPHLTASQIDDVVAFLNTLNGKSLKPALMRQPTRP